MVESAGDPCGSIPACAGEPRSLPHLQTGVPRHRVYPRVCGGAPPPCHRRSGRSGRSIPACAGEPRYSATGELVSIPACAGEPRDAFENGSIPACAGEPVVVDQSPEGHPACAGDGAVRLDGSIPACAGEPLSNI